MSTASPAGFEDAAACASCGGECCFIYRDADDPRFSPDTGGGRNPYTDFDEYVLGWFERFVGSGVLVDLDGVPCGWWGTYEAAPGTPDPLFDPFRLFIGDRADRPNYRASLPAWVSVDLCQYCHPETGCTLSRDRRPEVCLSYRCERLGGAAGQA